MEMFELRYFLAVAQVENVNRAAEIIHISPGSLSKAIARLEEELRTPLFFKSGRGIRLTPEGRVLKQRAAKILQMEEDVRLELAGQEAGTINLFISSEEILHTSFGIQIVRKAETLFFQTKTQFLIRTDRQVIQQVEDGEAQLGLITTDPPTHLAAKALARVEFKTTASKKHPLVKKYGGKAIPVSEVLEHAFVAPDSAILGRIAKADTIDGWRDDKFPRKIKYKVSGLKLMEKLIHDGMALAYLPDYYLEESDLVPLKVTGCPYSCHQTVRLIAKDPSSLGWLEKLWGQI